MCHRATCGAGNRATGGQTVSRVVNVITNKRPIEATTHHKNVAYLKGREADMKCRPYIDILAVLVFATAFGCVESTKVGLSNVRAREWRQARAEKGYDVISNGDDSCERPGSSQPDPTPSRLYPCPRIERETPRVAAKQ